MVINKKNLIKLSRNKYIIIRSNDFINLIITSNYKLIKLVEDKRNVLEDINNNIYKIKEQIKNVDNNPELLKLLNYKLSIFVCHKKELEQEINSILSSKNYMERRLKVNNKYTKDYTKVKKKIIKHG